MTSRVVEITSNIGIFVSEFPARLVRASGDALFFTKCHSYLESFRGGGVRSVVLKRLASIPLFVGSPIERKEVKTQRHKGMTMKAAVPYHCVFVCLPFRLPFVVWTGH